MPLDNYCQRHVSKESSTASGRVRHLREHQNAHACVCMSQEACGAARELQHNATARRGFSWVDLCTQLQPEIAVGRRHCIQGIDIAVLVAADRLIKYQPVGLDTSSASAATGMGGSIFMRDAFALGLGVISTAEGSEVRGCL